ncbi:MAG: hypothetical protein A3I66_00585 [Burkholderiales bacterium RIFCSPLOWO2_02_FULL_57_36]|nr:MAG: hypothetical protein A3I66_00585 [Burkholderiales bacterium RIFCSPLOWO2_02_FULL_57_36]
MTEGLIKIAAGIAAVLALLAGLYFSEQYVEGRGYDRAKAEDLAAIEKVKREAAETLASEIQETRKAEQALQDITNTQNIKDAKNEKTVVDLSDRLRRAADPAGRLRDPHAARCGGGGSSTPGADPAASGDRPADPTETGGLLSAEFSELLRARIREADDINDAYISCRADVYTVRAQN